MGPNRVRVVLLILLLLFYTVKKVHSEDLSLIDLEQSTDTSNLRASGASNEHAAVDTTVDKAANRQGNEDDLNSASDQGDKNIERTASYDSQADIEPDSQYSSDRSGQISPQAIENIQASEFVGGSQLSSDRSAQPSALALEYSPLSEIEADPHLMNGKPDLIPSSYSSPSEIETNLQKSSDRNALISLQSVVHSPSDTKYFSQILLDRSNQPETLSASHSPLSETHAVQHLRSGKPERLMMAYSQPSDILDPLDRNSYPSEINVAYNSQSGIEDPQTFLNRRGQTSIFNDGYSLTSDTEMDQLLKSGQPSPVSELSPQSNVVEDFNLKSGLDNQPRKLTVSYVPSEEIEVDSQLRSDRSNEANKMEAIERDSDARNYPKDFISKLKLALTPDDSFGNSATYTRRHIPKNEHIKLNAISGASALIQCSAEGEFYSVLTPWRQCMLCVCVGNEPQPVCVNCAECNDSGLKVPLPPMTSAAIGEALLSPTHLPFLPKRPIEMEFTTKDTERIKISQPSVPPRHVLPKEIARGRVPRSCHPLPTGQPFTHPLNPCQTCICQQTAGDVQISCSENSQCVLLPEQHANIAIPPENEPIPAPQCANMPPNVLFPHPTDQCKQCQCFEQVSSFNVRAPQLYCVSIPGCVSEVAPANQYPTPRQEAVVVIPKVPKVSTLRPPAFQSPVYTSEISKPQHVGQPGLHKPFMTPSLTQSLPVSPESGFISPPDTLLPHFNPPLIPEESESQAILPRVNEKIPELSNALEHLNPSEKPLAWPPKTVPALPRRTDGPLLGPPPHESCHPFPPNTMFQHPWNECQVCRCSEHHSIGHTSIEVNCFTKASCCIEPPQLISGDSSGLIQAENSELTPQDLELFSKNDDIIYLEARCRLRAPNKPFVVECQVCVCHVVYYFVVAKCTPQPGCIARENMLLGGSQLPETGQVSSISIPVNGALQPPMIENPRAFMAAAPKFEESGLEGQYGLPANKQNQMYQYPSSSPLQDQLKYSSQQQQYPIFNSQQFSQNFIPTKTYATPLPYQHQGFSGQNFLVNPQEKLLTGYQQQLNSQRPFESRYPNNLVSQPQLFNQLQSQNFGNTLRPYNYAHAQAISHAHGSQSWAEARAKSIQSFQPPGFLKNYRHDLMHGQPREIHDPVSNNSNSYAFSGDVSPTDATPRNVYPTNVYPTNGYPTNVYPTNMYPIVNEYATRAEFLNPSTMDPYGQSDERAALQYEKDMAAALSYGGGGPASKGGRGQCQYVGDTYVHDCQTCRCLADPHRMDELYSLCSGTPCR